MLKMVINLDYEMTLQEEMYLRKKFEKKNIRRVSNAAGLGVIGFVFIQLVLSVVIILPPLGNFYIENLTFQSAANVFLSVFGMLIPFAIAGIYLEKKTYTDVFKFNKPVFNNSLTHSFHKTYSESCIMYGQKRCTEYFTGFYKMSYIRS